MTTVPTLPTHAPPAADAWRALYQQARETVDATVYRDLCRQRRRLVAHRPPPPLPAQARIALVSGATTATLEDPLRLALEAVGVAPTLYATPYDTYVREMLDPASETAAFRPDVAVLVTTTANIPKWPAATASLDEVERTAREVAEHFLGPCRALHAHTGCEIVLGNFHRLPTRPWGTAGAKLPGEPNRFLRLVNEILAREAPPPVHLLDIDALAAEAGLHRWFDARYWHLAKQPVSFECLPVYVRAVAQIVAALRGRASKCVVVDLDNTLWGGVVGDDGPDRVLIGPGDPVGEAFAAFQRYLRSLRERGVLLAVSSKNDEQAALGPFSRPEMVLRRDDFVAFRANWRPKPENLREIAASLNIGLDALVFVDDNPAEREQVRQALPEVRVVELGPDPSDYAVQLDRTGWFDTVTVSVEDQARTAMYEANAAREALRESVVDYDAYLRSLAQRAVITPFREPDLDRITQLTNKTNQFNLTTRRLSRGELEAMMRSPAHITATARLIDRFGDNGLVSVFVATGRGADLWIDLWLMSCRVFHRRLEHALCNYVVERARAAGYQRLHGLYLPTPRNGIVREHYGAMGFSRCDTSDSGEHWVLQLEDYRPHEVPMEVVTEVAPTASRQVRHA